MRRAVAGLISVMSLALGIAVAHADQGGPWGGSGPQTIGVPVIGTVVTTDPSAGTFTANAFVPTFGHGDDNSECRRPPGPVRRRSGPVGLARSSAAPAQARPESVTPPTTTLVTIKTDPKTKLIVNGSTGTVSDMKAGDQFMALFNGSPRLRSPRWSEIRRSRSSITRRRRRSRCTRSWEPSPGRDTTAGT